MTSVENAPSGAQIQNQMAIQAPLDEGVQIKSLSAPANEIQHAASHTKIPDVWLLSAGDLQSLQNVEGDERKFWIKIYANVRKCQEDQRKSLAAMAEFEKQRQANGESRPGARDKCLYKWAPYIEASEKEFSTLRARADEIISLNKQISTKNAETGKEALFGQARPWPYLKPILSRPADYEIIEANPALLCALLSPFLHARLLQQLWEDLMSAHSQSSEPPPTLSQEDFIQELEDLNSKIQKLPEVQMICEAEDKRRATYNKNLDELRKLREEEENLSNLKFKAEQYKTEEEKSEEFKARVMKRQEDFDIAKAAWIGETKLNYEDDHGTYKEFASIFIPDEDDRLDLNDELLEPPEVEVIDEMTDLPIEEVHVEYTSKFTSENLPRSIQEGLKMLGREGGPLQTWIFSVKDMPRDKISIEAGNRQAWNELNALCQALLLKCDELGIDRAEFSVNESHLRCFVDMVQAAEAAYLELAEDPQRGDLQQNYVLVRQRAAIWLENNKFPANFVDTFVPPEKVIEAAINTNRGAGASGSEVKDPPRDPYQPYVESGDENLPPAPKPTYMEHEVQDPPQNPYQPYVESGDENLPPAPKPTEHEVRDPPPAPKPTYMEHEVRDPPAGPKSNHAGGDTAGAAAAADEIPLDDSEDQCTPIVECPPMTVYEDGVYKKVVDVIKIGFMKYGLLKWPGGNSKYPNLFRHELVPSGDLGDAVDQFLERYPNRKFVVASKPTKHMRWGTAQIGGSASVRRDPDELYKTHAVTYDWVKFKGQSLQHFRRSDLVSRYNRQRVEAKINEYLEMAGQNRPVPPTEQVFVKEYPGQQKKTAKTVAKKTTRKNQKRAVHRDETEDEGESICSNDECSEEDDDDEGNVSDLIDDEPEEDPEEIKKKNNELYWKKRRAELEAEEKAWLEELKKELKKKELKKKELKKKEAKKPSKKK